MNKVTIVPAVIPNDIKQVSDFIDCLGNIPEIHLDVVDGKFVPFTSWPYLPKGEPTDVGQILSPYTLEVDLMVANPIEEAEAWIKAGADMLVFHAETISYESFSVFMEKTSVSVGICASNDTPFSILAPYIDKADYVQVMGIRKIGTQGQPFDGEVKERIKLIKNVYPDISISIDGAMNTKTIPDILSCQIDRIIVGSAIIKDANPLQAYKKIQALLSSTVT